MLGRRLYWVVIGRGPARPQTRSSGLSDRPGVLEVDVLIFSFFVIFIHFFTLRFSGPALVDHVQIVEVLCGPRESLEADLLHYLVALVGLANDVNVLSGLFQVLDGRNHVVWVQHVHVEQQTVSIGRSLALALIIFQIEASFFRQILINFIHLRLH